MTTSILWLNPQESLLCPGLNVMGGLTIDGRIDQGEMGRGRIDQQTAIIRALAEV